MLQKMISVQHLLEQYFWDSTLRKSVRERNKAKVSLNKDDAI